jgi:hypothetical protein
MLLVIAHGDISPFRGDLLTDGLFGANVLPGSARIGPGSCVAGRRGGGIEASGVTKSPRARG